MCYGNEFRGVVQWHTHNCTVQSKYDLLLIKCQDPRPVDLLAITSLYNWFKNPYLGPSRWRGSKASYRIPGSQPTTADMKSGDVMP